MSSYTDIFGGSTIQAADISYAKYTIAVNLVLNWPIAFQDTPNVMARIIDVDPTVAGLTVQIPDATQVSVGQDVLFSNVGAFAFNVIDFAGNVLATINPAPLPLPPSATSWYFYLIDNTFPAGLWRTVPFAGGVSSVTSVNAVSLTPDITVVGGPIINAGTFTFNIGADLAAIVGVGAPGYLVKTAAATWTTRNIVQGENILITNPDGVAGNTTVALQPNLVNINTADIANFSFAGNNIFTTNPNGNFNFEPDGTGVLQSQSDIVIFNGKVLKLNNALNTNFAGFTSPAGVTGTIWNLPIADGTNGQVLQTNGALQLGWTSVVTFGGPSTDKAIARFNGTAGQIQNSGIILSDANDITGVNTIAIQNIRIGTGTIPANTIQSTNADGNIIFEPNGTGETQSVKNLDIMGANLLKFYNLANNQFISFKSANALGATVNFTLPQADATLPNQAIVSDGAGNLSFFGAGFAKAWVLFDGTAGAAILGQYNVANVVRTALGVYLVTFTNPMPNNTYAVVGSAQGLFIVSSALPTVNNITIANNVPGGAGADAVISVVVFSI